MGLGYQTADAGQSFLVNRLPNLLFVALQLPLLKTDFQSSIPAVVGGWFSRKA
jgi:hypothetical protein